MWQPQNVEAGLHVISLLHLGLALLGPALDGQRGPGAGLHLACMVLLAVLTSTLDRSGASWFQGHPLYKFRACSQAGLAQGLLALPSLATAISIATRSWWWKQLSRLLVASSFQVLVWFAWTAGNTAAATTAAGAATTAHSSRSNNTYSIRASKHRSGSRATANGNGTTTTTTTTTSAWRRRCRQLFLASALLGCFLSTACSLLHAAFPPPPSSPQLLLPGSVFELPYDITTSAWAVQAALLATIPSLDHLASDLPQCFTPGEATVLLQALLALASGAVAYLGSAVRQAYAGSGDSNGHSGSWRLLYEHVLWSRHVVQPDPGMHVPAFCMMVLFWVLLLAGCVAVATTGGRGQVTSGSSHGTGRGPCVALERRGSSGDDAGGGAESPSVRARRRAGSGAAVERESERETEREAAGEGAAAGASSARRRPGGGADKEVKEEEGQDAGLRLGQQHGASSPAAAASNCAQWPSKPHQHHNHHRNNKPARQPILAACCSGARPAALRLAAACGAAVCLLMLGDLALWVLGRFIAASSRPRLATLGYWFACLGVTVPAMYVVSKSSAAGEKARNKQDQAQRPPSPSPHASPRPLQDRLDYTAAAAARLAATLRVPHIVMRKGYHLLAILLFLPAFGWDARMLQASLAVAAAVLVMVELARCCGPAAVRQAIGGFMADFADARDSGPVYITHFTLLLGIALSVWLSDPVCGAAAGAMMAGLYGNEAAEPMTMPGGGAAAAAGTATSTVLSAAAARMLPSCRAVVGLSGLVSIGSGDTAAACVGFLLGRLRLFRGGKKTWEGTVSGFGAMLASWGVVAWWMDVRWALGWSTWGRLAGVTAGVALLEAVTEQLDNVVVPLYYLTHLVLVMTGN